LSGQPRRRRFRQHVGVALTKRNGDIGGLLTPESKTLAKDALDFENVDRGGMANDVRKSEPTAAKDARISH
jgi:hypothetical protein